LRSETSKVASRFFYTTLTGRILLSLLDQIPKMFIPLPIPVYSCEFNSIEKVWSFAKVQWKKQLLSAKDDIPTLQMLIQKVNSLFNDLDRKALDNLIYANSAYLQKTLKEAALRE